LTFSQNPMNWSLMKKFFVTFEICLLTFSVYIGSAIYSAGTLSVTMEFGVSTVAATLGLSLFVAGYGLGPMLWAPMSEIPQIGRNPIYIGTLVVFVLFQFPVIYAGNFGMLLAFRFLTGFFGSPVLATGGASIGDMYKPSKRAYGIAIWGKTVLFLSCSCRHSCPFHWTRALVPILSLAYSLI
jgi:DHA1 family multidrug resistance protein-like MFS transporter